MLAIPMMGQVPQSRVVSRKVPKGQTSGNPRNREARDVSDNKRITPESENNFEIDLKEL
jgi:hypothetical protein